MEKQNDRQMEGQKDRQMASISTDRRTDCYSYRLKEIDRQTNRQTDGQTGKQTGGQTVGQKEVNCRVVSSLQIIIFPNCIMKVGLHVHNNTLDSIGQFPSDKE